MTKKMLKKKKMPKAVKKVVSKAKAKMKKMPMPKAAKKMALPMMPPKKAPQVPSLNNPKMPFA
jgi:hypothetical protein